MPPNCPEAVRWVGLPEVGYHLSSSTGSEEWFLRSCPEFPTFLSKAERMAMEQGFDSVPLKLVNGDTSPV